MTISLEDQAIIAYLVKTGVPNRVTSTITGDHAVGSYHFQDGTGGKGLAVDFAEALPSHDSPGLLRIFAAFGPVESSLAEAIYYDAPYCIKNGKRVNGFSVYGRITMEEHRNHVHIAVPKGTMLVPITDPKPIPGGPVMPDPAPPDYEVAWTPVSIAVTPSGKGYYILGDDGSIYSFGDAIYLGRVHKKI
jgi:hypothetical protein